MDPLPETKPVRDDDGYIAAALLFGLWAGCMALAAWLYWHGAGRLPWQ